MKPIILTIFTLQGGGAERFVLTLAEAFRDLGHRVHIICFKSECDYTLPDDIHFHCLNYQSFRAIPKGILRYRLFARIFDTYVKKHIGSPQLILSNLREVDAVLHYSQLKPIVYVLHNTLSIEYDLTNNPTVIKTLRKRYQNHPVVGVSNGVVDDYCQSIGEHTNISAIHNPINQAKIIAASQHTPQNLPPRYIVHVGKFKPQKDHHSLIQAYAQAAPTLPLVLVGTGALMEECRTLATDLGVADKVIFAGFHENPYPYIRHATLMVLSSQFEGFGIVIAEALALGIPVISTDCDSGPRELLPAQNLVPVGDIVALANKISAAIAEPTAYYPGFDEDLLPITIAKKYLAILA